jgi:septum formation protein
MTELVLASASAVRATVLKHAGVHFRIEPAAINEEAIKTRLIGEGRSPREIADALAEAKALERSVANPDALVIGADQILVYEGECISKSRTLDDAAKLLRRLRGNLHRLVGAVVLAQKGEPVWRHLDTATLWMREFSDAFLNEYLAAEGESLLVGVGCYRLEGRGIQLFTRIEGDHFAILGLPLLPLLAALRERGLVTT